MPWAIDESEAGILEAGMKLCMRVAYHLQEDPGYLDTDEEDKSKLRFFRLDEGEWISDWESPDSLVELSPPQLKVDQDLVAELKELPKGKDLWLFERFFFRQPSMDEEGGRPFFPVMFLLMDMQTQVIGGMDMVRPHRLVEDGGGVLMELLREGGKLPAGLIVSNKENYILLHGIGRALGLEIHLEDSLDVLGDIKEALYQHMDQEG